MKTVKMADSFMEKGGKNGRNTNENNEKEGGSSYENSSENEEHSYAKSEKKTIHMKSNK